MAKRNIKEFVLLLSSILCLSGSGFIMGSCAFDAVEITDPYRTVVLNLGEPAKGVRNLEKYTDFEFIPLDNAREALISNFGKMIVTDSLFYIYDQGSDYRILSFNHDGRFNGRIGEKGHTNREYVNIENFSVNSNGDTVVILEFDHLKFYDSDGKFLKMETFEGPQCWDDVLYSTSGVMMGSHYRKTDHLLALYDADFQESKNLIWVDSTMISSPPYSYNQIQQVGDTICFLDYFSSSFYVFSLNDLQHIQRYQLHSDNILNEERARNGNLMKERYDLVEYYVFDGSRIVGEMRRDDRVCNFEISLDKETIELYDNYDFGCNFASYHNGYYYKLLSAGWIKDMYDLGRLFANPQMRQAIEPFISNMTDKDNLFVFRMKYNDKYAEE